MTPSLDYELIRKTYLPSRVRVLYIGESRPHNGTFFYLQNSLLYSAIFESYTKLFPEMSNHFLEHFARLGLYLDDLVDEPVNHLDTTIRLSKRNEGIPSLAKRIQLFKPNAIICVIKSIEEQVFEAIKLSKSQISYLEVLPFPTQNYKSYFINKHIHILKDLDRKGILGLSI